MQMIEPFIADELPSLLVGTIFGGPKLLHHFASIDSTNAHAMQAAAKGAPEGSIFIADMQSAGRGRGGHAWHSEANSGLYISLVLRPKLPPDSILSLSLMSGLAAQDAVLSVSGLQPDLRWPNDIMLGHKKMGGILTEISADSKRVNHAVIGIGLNISQSDFSPEIAHLATSLRIETGRIWPRLDLAAALLRAIDSEYCAFQAQPDAGIASILKRFESISSYVRGARVEVHENGIGVLGYTGITRGLDHRGFLRVETTDGLRTLISGGIRKI